MSQPALALDRKPAASSGRSWSWRLDVRALTLAAVTILTIVAVGSFDHGFVTVSNLRFMLLNSIVLSLVALGQTLVIATRGIDLSVAPILGLSAVVTGLLAQNSGLPLAGAVVIALCIGLILGGLNGILVARLSIPPIITTLGTYSLYSGLIFIVSNGVQVTSVPAAYATFGNGVISGLLPVPIPVLVLGFTLLGMWFLLGHTTFGRGLLAVGNNKAAAYNAGIKVTWIQVGAYTLSGILAAAAGLMFVSYTGSATVTTGTGDHVELQSIAVALIGGTAIAGGRGNVVGTVLGSVFLSVILTALVFVHVPPIWYSAGEGLMILLTVTAGSRR
jgi:ribose/xylose/arabinose/galactoside ABC-type transport system permease subunit